MRRKPSFRSDSGTLAVLLRTELRMLLRDRRTLLLAVIAPLVIFPAYILILRFVESRERKALEEAVYGYAVTGSQADWAAELVEAALARPVLSADSSFFRPRFHRLEPADPFAALGRGDLRLVVEGLSAQEWDSLRAFREEAPAPSPESAPVAPVDPRRSERGVPALRLHFRGDSDFSTEAYRQLRGALEELRLARRDSLFRAAGFPLPLQEVVPVEAVSVASRAKEAGVFLGTALTPLLVLLMLSGGSIVAVDALSGEKERGTLETLLTTGARRSEIVRAKLLAVVAVGLAVAVFNVVNLVLYLVAGLIELPASLAVELRPVDTLLLLLLFLPLALLVAAALLLVSGASKSYREFQVYWFPLFVAFLLPSLVGALPGADLRSLLALVPVAGVALAVREILVGELDLPFVALAFLSTTASALYLTRLTEASLSNEKLISGADLEASDLTGGPALFPRRVLGWFAAFWVVFFLANLWLGGPLGLRGQILLNLLGIFGVGSWFLVRRYRLDPREALGLRRPPPAAWPAVLLGAPSALLLAVSGAELVNRYVLPVPEEVLQGFQRELLSSDLPPAETLLFLVGFPALFEELAFRGVLLHGLRQRIRNPWILAATVGMIFGLFHVSLFRILPTAWLGFLLTWVVLLSGSVYPAILWHALNNALAVFPHQFGWLPSDASPSAGWAVPAAVGLALSFRLLRIGGRPSPSRVLPKASPGA